MCFSVGAFAGPFKVLSWKKDRRLLFYNGYLLGVKKFHATLTKQDLDTSWEFFSKFLTSIPMLLLGSFSNRMGTSNDDWRVCGIAWIISVLMWPYLEIFFSRTSPSSDLPVLLLNQPIIEGHPPDPCPLPQGFTVFHLSYNFKQSWIDCQLWPNCNWERDLP